MKHHLHRLFRISESSLKENHKESLGSTQLESQKQDFIAKKLSNGMTLNEARIENGLPPKDGFDVPGTVAEAVQWRNGDIKSEPEFQRNLQHSQDHKEGPDDNQSPLSLPDNGNNKSDTKK